MEKERRESMVAPGGGVEGRRLKRRRLRRESDASDLKFNFGSNKKSMISLAQFGAIS